MYTQEERNKERNVFIGEIAIEKGIGIQLFSCPSGFANYRDSPDMPTDNSGSQ